MSEKSGVAAPIISLPTGGGALKGLGETFATDLHTGTGSATIPIPIPMGRNGFQPDLSLTYSTGNGNGPFGLGWSLAVPRVSRKTSHGIPSYGDGDVFILSGAEDLVPIDRGPGVTTYRPRTEGLFARIEHHRSSDNDFWQVWSKDGRISWYGTPKPEGAETTWRDPAVLADPANQRRIFAWMLSETRDPCGNRIVYQYREHLDETATSSIGPLYLERVRYVDFGNRISDRFLVSVTLDYEARPDAFFEARSGFEVQTRFRCREIAVWCHAEHDTKIRSLQLSYVDDGPTQVSLLAAARWDGLDDERTQMLPPLAFGYAGFNPQARRLLPLQGPDLPAKSLADATLELADLNGNGLPDFVEIDGGIRYWRNLGNGQFDRARAMATAPTELTLASAGVQLMDADGDGRIDLLTSTEPRIGFFSLTGSGHWNRRSFRRHEFAPSFAFDDPEVRLLDLDGNGVTDVLRSGTRFECYFNDPVRGWQTSRFLERGALEVFPDVSFADPRVKIADMNGDGLADIVLVHDGRIDYWPSLGHGRFGRRRTMKHSPRLPEGFDLKRVLFGDIDGDGLADILLIDDGKVRLWLNQAGTGFSAPIVIQGTPSVSDTDAVRLVDLLGTGVVGILWSSDVSSTVGPSHVFLDFTGGQKPYLLNQIDNNLGALTQIAYAPSTRFYLSDEVRPATRWQTSLPFPVQVVAIVEVIDQITESKLTTEYRYRHGYWDGTDREFRGFGQVTQRDSEVFGSFNRAGLHDNRPFERITAEAFSPPLETISWFHLGPIGEVEGDWLEPDYRAAYWASDPPALVRDGATSDLLKRLPRRARRDALRALRGTLVRTELYAIDGGEREARPYTVTEQVHGLREENPPADIAGDRQRIFFPHVLASRVTQWERGDDPLTRIEITGRHDAFGYPQRQIAIAVPRGRNYRHDASGPAYLATRTETVFAHRSDATRYLAGRVAKVTTHEIIGADRGRALDLPAAIEAGDLAERLIDQALSYYDGPAFLGLPFGQLGDHGLLSRTETLVFTAETLASVYGGSTVVPPYLLPSSSVAWSDEYPEQFRASLPPLAGYVFHEAASGEPQARGYFATTLQQAHDTQADLGRQPRGLVVAQRDPLGRETRIEHDAFALFSEQVIGPTGLATRALHDYKAFQPRRVIDPNGNHSIFGFTPLGLLSSSSIMGKLGETDGDTVDTPSLQLDYDLLAFIERRQPVSVLSRRRVHHINAPGTSAAERDQTITTVEFSDGFGRLLQTRAQAAAVAFGDASFGQLDMPAAAAGEGDIVGRVHGPEQPPRVAVSGMVTRNNKGRVVEAFEPFFAEGFAYAKPSGAALGQKIRTFYDPRGQIVRVVQPDGAEQRTVFGLPFDLADPERHTPTPWEAFAYDANDNAGRTHPDDTIGYREHWNTPGSIEIDALGRTVRAVARNGADPSNWHTTRSTYDVQGNLLTIMDELGRVAFRHAYDLAGNVLRTDQLDGGTTQVVLDPLGSPVEQRGGAGSLVLQAYDALQRPSRLWASDDLAANSPTLRQLAIYGEDEASGLTTDAARALNLLGKPFRHYDEAGLATVERYDFKGNALESTRQVIGDGALLAVFAGGAEAGWTIRPFQIDWQPPGGTSFADHAASQLDPVSHRLTYRYDALNRPISMLYPDTVEGKRPELRPRYDQAGALQRVELDGTALVRHIARDAKGQRSLVVHGNGVITRHVYDPKTMRLVRLRSELCDEVAPFVFRPIGQALQDFAYSHDLIGNLLTLVDRTPGSGIIDNPDAADVADQSLARQLAAGEALIRRFSHDPLYRLTGATGRESDLPPPAPPWQDTPRGTDLARVRGYTERYQYDAAGNLLELQHQIAGGGFTRRYQRAEAGNRLGTLTVGTTELRYVHDAAGRLIQENGARHFAWSHAGTLRAFRVQAGTAEPSIHAQYLYDAAGQRVKKLVRRQGGNIQSAVYVGGLFELQRETAGSTERRRNLLHVMDDSLRIALVRIGTPAPSDATPTLKLFLVDHLGSSNVTLDGAGATVSREEYTPFGETSFGSFALQRYRFTGKERDEESGLYYHGARYYLPWLARWASPDPAGIVDGLNLYAYARNAPLRLVDASGLQGEGPKTQASAPLPEEQAANASLSGSDAVSREGGRSEASNLGPPHADAADQGFLKSLVEASNSYRDPVSRRRADALKQQYGLDANVRYDLTNKDLDQIQDGLDVAGMMPGVGEPIDFLNAGISAIRGKYGQALLSVGAMVPVVGMAATAAKNAKIVSPIVRYADRDILVVRASDRMQAFYRSTGDAPGSNKGIWYPFNGIDYSLSRGDVSLKLKEWFNKMEFETSNIDNPYDALNRFGTEEMKHISDQLGRKNIYESNFNFTNMRNVNEFLEKYDARRDPMIRHLDVPFEIRGPWRQD